MLSYLQPIRNSYAQYSNACYCTTTSVYNTTYGGYTCTANADCWACAPGAFTTSWQSAFCPNYQAPVSTCQQVSETQTQTCPVNYTGQITQTRIKTCPDNQWQAWQTTQNTCVANPPTCQTSSQQQTLACPTGYTGSITQTRSSMCPDPYGQPVWGPWATTSDSCKKSVNNPTNPVSPVNPASPVSQPTTTFAPTIQSSPVTVSTPNTAPNSVATPTETTTTATETKTDAQTTTVSPTTSTTPAIPTPPVPKGKSQSVVGLVLSLELFVKPGLQQANVFPEVSIVQGIPNNILMQDSIMMDLLQQTGFNQPAYNQDLGFEQ